MEPDIDLQLNRLEESAALRRVGLLALGLSKARNKKLLNIAAGVLAIFSGAIIVSVIAKLLGPDVPQLVAAAAALLSGTTNAILAANYDDKEIAGILAASARYLSLRQDVERTRANTRISPEQKLRVLKDHQAKYSELDESYSRYFPSNAAQASRAPPAPERLR